MSITASNNPFSCTPVLVGNNNAILELGTITRVSNTFTFSIGFKWRINALTYQNASAINLTIIPATTGFKRIDVAVLNTSNTIELLSGVESETIALQPTIPVNALILTTWNINGATIEDEATPLIGEDYVKKSFAQGYVYPDITGADASVPIPASGASKIILTNTSLTSIACLDLSAITGNPSAEVPYPNKVLEITNATGNDLEIKHLTGSGIQFFLKEETPLIIPNKETLFVNYDDTAATESFRSWSEGGETPLIFSDTTMYTHTGTTAGTLITEFVIPPNTIPNNSIWEFEVVGRRGAVDFEGSCLVNSLINSSGFLLSVPLGSTINTRTRITRSILFKDGFAYCFYNSGGFYSDYVSNLSRKYTFDITIENRIKTYLQLGDATKTGYLDYVLFKKVN